MSEKSAAHAYIGYMIRSGRLKPAKKRRCVDCNKRAQQYDHHEGYGGKNKTNVQPVCCSCHLKRTYARGEKRTNSAAISGSKHYNWKGGVSRDRNKYQRNWRRKNLRNPAFRAAINKKSNDYYHAHAEEINQKRRVTC